MTIFKLLNDYFEWFVKFRIWRVNLISKSTERPAGATASSDCGLFDETGGLIIGIIDLCVEVHLFCIA